MAQEYIIALGSNLGSSAGSPAATLRAALVALARAGISLRRVSRFFATPCFPAGTGPDYANACAVVADASDPEDFLLKLHTVEETFGRAREQRWGARSLDLDLIAAGDIVLPDPETQARWRGLDAPSQQGMTPDRLILPHPRLQDRPFVLVPMRDVAAGWRHPELRQSVASLCAALPARDRRAVVPIDTAHALLSDAMRVT